MTTNEFIQSNLTADVHQLALTASRHADIDLPYALTQIEGWQRAKTKLPLWAATQGIIFPQSLPMEQCSSQVAAEYKAHVWTQLGTTHPAPTTMTDLTAGFGVDATMLGRCFDHVTLIEQNPELCRLASHNMTLLGIKAHTIINSTCQEAIYTLPHQNLIFIDPARRDNHGHKTILLSDCSPDITMLQDTLLERADYVMAKLSPMLDVTAVARTLTGITALHIVSVGNECKEIIAVMSRKYDTRPMLHCINLPDTPGHLPPSIPEGTNRLSLPLADILNHTPSPTGTSAHCPVWISSMAQTDKPATTPTAYLYEPNPSVMKAGVFQQVATQFGIHQLHPNSHLYLSAHYIDKFPGRKFRLTTICPLNKTGEKHLRQLGKANITVRNFPLSVAQLRQRLHLDDGGSTYIFATTIAPANKRLLLICEKTQIR